MSKTPPKRKPNLKTTPQKKDNPPLKAYGYVRVSTQEQATEGFSLQAQEHKIRAYASFKDLELVEIIRDEGVSGKDFNRPGFQQLLELISSGNAQALIVYKLDRLTRNTSNLLQLVEDIFEQGNTRFFSICEEIDTDTAMGRFFLTIMGAMAQMERELISERTSAVLQHKKQQGQSLGLVPYGYQRIQGKLEKMPEEQSILRRMKRWRKEGLSYKKIAERLNQKDIKPRRQKASWHSSSVYYILNRTPSK
jgi:DNA invertase Pin-like site-specific DNA recombinase